MDFFWPWYSRHTWQVTHDYIHSSDCVLGDFPGVTLQCFLQTKQTDLLDPLHCDVKDPILALPRQGDFQLHLVTEREKDRVEREIWLQTTAVTARTQLPLQLQCPKQSSSQTTGIPSDKITGTKILFCSLKMSDLFFNKKIWGAPSSLFCHFFVLRRYISSHIGYIP